MFIVLILIIIFIKYLNDNDKNILSTNLTTVYVGSGWSTASVTDSVNMLTNTLNIRGMLGTTYNVNHIDKGYARVDGGQSNPGYFSMYVGPLQTYDANGGGVSITSNFLATSIQRQKIESISFVTSISGYTPNGIDCWDIHSIFFQD